MRLTHGRNERPPPRWVGWALAGALVMVALLARWSVSPAVGNRPLLILFVIPIIISGYLGGRGPGLLATVLGAMGTMLFRSPPDFLFNASRPEDWFQWLVLWAAGILLSELAEALHGAQRRALKEARGSQASYRLLHAVIEGISDAVFVKDREGRFLMINSAGAKLLGRPAERLIGKRLGDVLAPDEVRGVADIERQIITDGEINTSEQLMTVGGVRRLFLTTKGPYRNQNGEIIGVLGIGRDITERKQVDEVLRESEERFRALAAATFEGIAITEQGRYIDANEQLLQMLGYGWDECIGREVATDIPAEDRERVLGNIREGRESRIEHAMIRKDGKRIIVEAHGRTVDYQNRKVRFTAVRDITHRREQEDELRQSKTAVEAASRAKDQFLAVLSHELRNPLNPILATASMLRNDASFDADTREQLEIICRNAELETRLIDDLLDVTRIERGKIELNRRPIELCTIIRWTVETCMPDIEARKLVFGMDLGPAACWMEADAARLQQVFWNLLNNAVKFTPEGGSVRVCCRRDGNRFVETEVSDSGEGIDPAALGRIFNAFEQAERSITRQFGGLGLGLTISKAIVEMHGGSIRAASQGKGKGATFTVRLPLISSPAAVPAPEPKCQPPAAKAPLRSLRILLVEDHDDTVKVMRRLLVAEGHEVATAVDMASALEAAGGQTFDLLLSDLGLPDGNGWELMRTLRAQGMDLPAIALSGYGQDSDIQRSHEAGFVTHLTKPLSLPKLKEAIAQAVGDDRK